MKRLFLAFAFTLMGTSAAAATVTVGNEAISRGTSDLLDNFGVVLKDSVFPDGVITDWQVFTSGGPGRIQLLVLDQTTAREFSIADVLTGNVVDGLNSFSGLNTSVSNGQFLGFVSSGARVDYEAGTPLADATIGEVFTAQTGAEAGDFLNISFPDLGRIYSINATVDTSGAAAIPLPASALLLITGLGVWRRKSV